MSDTNSIIVHKLFIPESRSLQAYFFLFIDPYSIILVCLTNPVDINFTMEVKAIRNLVA